jgi:MoaD family protein
VVKVKFSGTLRQIAGRAEMTMELPASRRLGEVLQTLAAVYPGILGDSTDLQWRHGSSHVVVAVNGRVIEEGNGEAMLLADNDEVSLVPPLGGGSEKQGKVNVQPHTFPCE